MKIIIEKDISDYATSEQFRDMLDDDIIDMCLEDFVEFIDDAEWKVIRRDRNDK